jgi:hypothetical protein
VPEYRAFTVGPDGHFTGHEDMICRDDGEAVIKAMRLMNSQDQDIENLERRSSGYEAETKGKVRRRAPRDFP